MTVIHVDEILTAKRQRLADRKSTTPIEAIRALASMQKRPLPLLNTVTAAERAILIGQICYAPHDDDPLAYDPVGEAVRYARGGVQAIGLFTDAADYTGGLDDLTFVSRELHGLRMPVITLDYIFDEYQVVEARAAGAAALVLEASLLRAPDLRKLISATQRNLMTAIVRVANDAELTTALAYSPQVIWLDPPGVANQLDTAALGRLRDLLPTHMRVLARAAGDLDAISRLTALNVDAVLIDQPDLLSAPDLPARLKRPPA